MNSTQQAPMITMKVPPVGESITEVTIAFWHKKSGDYVAKDEIIAELESEKATFEINAEIAGTLQILAKASTDLPIGHAICTITPVGKEPSLSQKKPLKKNISLAINTFQEKIPPLFSPVASKILSEQGIDPSQIQGTGPKGKITKKDVLATTSSDLYKKNTVATSKLEKDIPNDYTESIDGIQQYLVNKPMMTCTIFDEVNMSALVALKSQYQKIQQQKNIDTMEVHFLSFFVKAVCTALHTWSLPKFFAQKKEILDGVVGIDFSTKYGNVAPVLSKAHQMSLDMIEKKCLILAEKAAKQQLSLEEMTGGLLTITHVEDMMLATPKVYAPRPLSIGMYRIVEKLVVVDQSIMIQPMMFIALAYDSAVVEEKSSIQLLKIIKNTIENPLSLLL